MNNTGRPHLLGLLAGLFLAAGLIFSAMLVSRAWLKIAESQTINATGSARKNVRSDLIIWRGSFSAEADTLLNAQQRLKDDLPKIENFLKVNGVTNYILTPIAIQELRSNDGAQKRVGFRLTQSLEIHSPEVDQITKLSRDSTVLVEQGVFFTTEPPEYIYTKASEAKIEMLAEATKDARLRAEQIASQGARMIHELRAARMGVFQVTPLYSSQTSSEGINDTSSLEKTVTAVVTASFSLK
ncbi:MAG: SIMPL domain-containing protein [Verrucomicrobiota bacterium]